MKYNKKMIFFLTRKNIKVKFGQKYLSKKYLKIMKKKLDKNIGMIMLFAIENLCG